MTNHADLIARLEALEGPDREADLLILECAHTEAEIEREMDIPGYPRRYTSSLDAALTLVPGGWLWQAGRSNIGMENKPNFYSGPFAQCHRPGWRWFGARGATPAIALTTAALKARGAEQ